MAMRRGIETMRGITNRDRPVSETGGRVLAAQPTLRDGRQGYRIKLLTPDDRIRILFVPAD